MSEYSWQAEAQRLRAQLRVVEARCRELAAERDVRYTEEQVFMALGFITAEVPELRTIEVPRLAEPFARALKGDFTATPVQVVPDPLPPEQVDQRWSEHINKLEAP